MAMKKLIIEFGQGVDMHGGANPEGIALNGKPKTEITIAIVALTVFVEV